MEKKFEERKDGTLCFLMLIILSLFLGIIAGLVIRYTGGRKTKGYPVPIHCDYAPQTLWLTTNLSNYSYALKGPLHTVATQESGELETKVSVVAFVGLLDSGL